LKPTFLVTNFAKMPEKTRQIPKFILILGLLNLWFTWNTTASFAATTVQFTVTHNIRLNVGVAFYLKVNSPQSKIEKADFYYRLGKNGKERAIRSAKFTSGNTASAEVTLSTDKDGLAAGMPVSYFWRITTAEKQQFQSEEKKAVYEDTRFAWQEVSGSNVVIRWYRGDSRYGQQMYNLAIETLLNLRKRFAVQVDQPIYLSVYATKAEFFQIAPANTPNWAGGFANIERNEIALIAPQDSLATVRIGEGIPHEVTHAALYQAIGQRLPRWFDEGFAVYNQNIKSEDYYRVAKAAFEKGNLLDFAEISNRFPVEAETAALAYAQGASLVDFLVVRYGDKVVANLLDQLRLKPFEEALQATLGVGQAILVKEWQNYLQAKPVALPEPLLINEVQPALPPRQTENEAVTPATPTTQINDNSGLILAITLMGGGVVLLVVVLLINFKSRRPKNLPEVEASPNTPVLVTPPPKRK
jgi:hypothetical protein